MLGAGRPGDVCFLPRKGPFDMEIGNLPDRQHHGVAGDGLLGVVDELGTEAAIGVKDRGHVEGLKPGHQTALAENALRTAAVDDAHALFESFVDLDRVGGHLVARARGPPRR